MCPGVETGFLSTRTVSHQFASSSSTCLGSSSEVPARSHAVSISPVVIKSGSRQDPVQRSAVGCHGYSSTLPPTVVCARGNLIKQRERWISALRWQKLAGSRVTSITRPRKSNWLRYGSAPDTSEDATTQNSLDLQNLLHLHNRWKSPASSKTGEDQPITKVPSDVLDDLWPGTVIPVVFGAWAQELPNTPDKGVLLDIMLESRKTYPENFAVTFWSEYHKAVVRGASSNSEAVHRGAAEFLGMRPSGGEEVAGRCAESLFERLEDAYVSAIVDGGVEESARMDLARRILELTCGLSAELKQRGWDSALLNAREGRLSVAYSRAEVAISRMRLEAFRASAPMENFDLGASPADRLAGARTLSPQPPSEAPKRRRKSPRAKSPSRTEEDKAESSTSEEGVAAMDPNETLFTLAELERELEDVVGLEELKRQLRRWAKGMLLDRRRVALGAPVGSPSRPHMLFLGSPGTGKTTVARMLARLMHRVGVLSKPKVVEVQRSDLVGQYIGHTAALTRAKIREAKGGILFVDEAYRLMPARGEERGSGTRDYGQEALEEIMAHMETSDFVAIFAGYKDAMQRVLDSNEGFRRRISISFTFDDYSSKEIAQILLKKMQKPQEVASHNLSGFWLEEACNLEAITQLLDNYTTDAQRNVRNGGLALSVLIKARENLDERLELSCNDLDELMTLRFQDLELAMMRLPQE